MKPLHKVLARPHAQRGAALMIMLVIMVMGVVAFFVGSLSSTAIQIKRDEVTANALAQAKEALIGYAATHDTPGKLPCPEDTGAIGGIYEGKEQANCGNATVIGRLPWRALHLDDIRDGNGDRLWYARSAGFYSSPINSDTPAQLTVDLVPNKAVAIIFSVGTPINGQSRPVPTSSTPPDVAQYLELSNSSGGNTFVSTGPTGSFNDKLLLITPDELFRVVEKRVAGEVKNCLNDYALNNGGLYPWASPWNTLTYADTSGTLSGRIPDTPFSNTVVSNTLMNNTWGGLPCKIISNSGWWLDWKGMVFYQVSNEYSPTPTGTTLLTVNPPSAIANNRFVVIVAGKMLAALPQARSSVPETTNLSNYLEAPNNGGTTTFAQSGVSATFNDTVVFQ